MKKRVDELIRETYVYESPKLESSVPEICAVLEENSEVELKVTITSSDGTKLRGIVYSDNHRITLKNEEISGNPCTIGFSVSSSALTKGNRISGNIIAATSQGEISIPVNVDVINSAAEEVRDEMQALEEFKQLAQRSPRKAFQFFISPEFSERVLNGKNVIYRALYKGLSKNPVTYQHLEEFLVATGKKEPVHISIDKQEKNVYYVNASMKDTLYIFKNTWGFCNVEVSKVGDFIEIEKTEITSDDFIGSYYGLEFIINKDKLSAFHHIGKIILKTVYEQIEVEIEAAVEEDMKLLSMTYRKSRKLRLIQDYLKLQLKQLDYHTWYENSSLIIEELKEDKEDGLTIFGEAYLAYCNEDNKRATEILWRVKTGEYVPTELWEKAAYLYLAKAVGLLPEESRDIAPKLYAYYQQQSDCFLLLALYMKEDEAAPYKAIWGLNEYEKAYEMGCCSPFLYHRAWKEFNKQESLLRSLTPFSLRVLLFAQKKGILTDSLLLRAAYLSKNDKNFRPAVYKLLKTGYEKTQHKDILDAICRYIMKDDVTKTSYYTWYEKAVEEGLKMTRLFENYVETRPVDETADFPYPVKIYFAYNHTLGEKKKAFLYSAVIRYKNVDVISYDNYKKEMESFAIKQLSLGNISKDLSVLYSEFIVPRKDIELATSLAKVVFTYRLTVEDPAIRKVIICHPSLNEECSYDVVDGVAYPNIYGPDAAVLLEDDIKRRFSTTIPYTLTPLMDIKKAAEACVKLGVWDTGLQLYCCHERGWQMEVNTKTVLSFLKAAENPEFTRKYRDRLRRKLLVYFNRQPNDPYAQKFAEKIKEAIYGWVDKPMTFGLLMSYGLYDKAYAMIQRLTWDGLDSDLLLKLASYKAQALEFAEETYLINLCSYLFRAGKYNEKTLLYLSNNFAGSISLMERIWVKTLAAKQETEKIEEKILLSSMFTKQLSTYSEEILENYSRGGGNGLIIKAYLCFLSYSYLLEDKKLSKATLNRIGQLIEAKDDHLRICSLAWIKHHAGLENVLLENRPKIKKLLNSLNNYDLRFSYMKNFDSELLGEMDIADRTFVEERFPSGSEVVIHYKMDGGDYKSEPMKARIKGIYVREFLLFFKEELEYYCTVTYKGETFDTEVKTVSIENAHTKGKSPYHVLNRLLAAGAAGAEGSMEEAALEYMKQQVLVDTFFEIQ